VEHESHIGAVDAHAECHRGHDHVDRLLGEGILGAASLGWFEAGVVGSGEDASGSQSVSLREMQYTIEASPRCRPTISKVWAMRSVRATTR
jgi:hypothetical protein